MAWRRRLLGMAFGLVALGCSDEAAKGSFPNNDGTDNGGQDGSDAADGSGGGDGNDGSDDGGPVLPPEDEEFLTFDTPQAGKTSVYVPNPTTNRVAVVNATTFAIETLKTGRAPTYTATVPGQDIAIVINVGSADAALLRTKNGETTSQRLDVGHDANAIAIAPDGRHAVLYFDARQSDELATSFQDVTVIKLESDKEASRGVSVGFRPRAVQFSADGARAFVLTEDGVSIIDLDEATDGPVIARLVPVGDKLSDAVSSDVQVTPDGAYALARRDGDTTLRLVDLESGGITGLDLRVLAVTPDATPDAGTGDAGTVDAGAEDAGGDDSHLDPGAIDITDVDLAPDGSFALAVVRNQGALVRIPVPQGFNDPSTIRVRRIEDQLVGSVTLARTGELAVAYTTAAPVEGIVLVDLTSNAAPRGVRLRKAVRAVALSQDGTRAFVLHAVTAGTSSDPNDPEDRIDNSEGYSLVDTETGFAKLELTPARVRERDLVVTPDTTRMFALLRDDARAVRSVTTADLGSFQVETLPLPKPPSSIGVVPSVGRVFIGQESEGGMITFLDAETGEIVRAVTGFELASRIRQ